MGLFSSSVKYKAHAGSSTLLEEDTREDTVQSMMLQASLGGSSTLAEAIKMGLNTNMYARAKSMYKYAGREYVYGYPETDGGVISWTNPEVKSVLETLEGEEINIISLDQGKPDPDFIIHNFIKKNYLNTTYFNWPAGDPLTTEWDIGLAQVEIPVQNPDYDPAADPPESRYYLANNPPEYTQLGPAAGYATRVYFEFTDRNGDERVWYLDQNIFIKDTLEADYITVRYSTVSDPDTTKYWMYRLGTNSIPEIEGNLDRVEINLEYLPIVMLMRDTVWFDEEGDEELERTTDRILSRLALDPYEMKEQYIQQVEEAIENGDRPGERKLDDWDFFIQFAVPIFSNIRGSREYLFHYFQNIQGAMPTYEDYQSWLESGRVISGNFISGNWETNQPYGEIHITEGGENGYNSYYRYSYIHSVTRVGVYTPDGWADPLRPRRMYSKDYRYTTPGYADGIREVHGEDAALISDITTSTWKQLDTNGESHDYFVFTRQNEPDDNGVDTYTQVLVMGPSMKYVVNTRDELGGDGTYRVRDAEVELYPEDIEEESEFKIPVHIGTMRQVAAMHREEMLQDALCATVYLVSKEKVKWYQKTFFKWLIIIIIVIIIIIFQQYELLGEVAQLAGTALATGAVGTAIAFAALWTVMAFSLGFLISFAGSLIGGTWGQIFVIAAAIYLGGTNLGQDWTALVSNPGWGTATTFLATIGPYMDAAMLVYSEYELDKLEDQMRDFEKSAKEKMEELQNAYDSLGEAPSWLDPMNLVRVFSSSNMVESPENYYARTLNANPGLIGYDFITEFSNLALTLPEKPGQKNVVEAMFDSFEKQRGAV